MESVLESHVTVASRWNCPKSESATEETYRGQVAESRADSNELKELLEISREYLTAIRLKDANAGATGARQMELSALFTHCPSPRPR